MLRVSVEAASPHLFLDPIPVSPYFERVNISGQGIAAGFTVERAIESLQRDPRVRTQSAYFFDDVESTSRFSGQTGTTWAVTAENSHSGRKSYSDSPGSNYPSGYFDSSLTIIDSVLVTKPMAFRFWAKTDLDLYNAYQYVEVSVNGGSSWAYTGYLTGTLDWSEYIFYINDYFNMNFKVRFQLVSYGGTARDGVWLDDIQFIQLNTIFLDNTEGATQFTGLAPWAITNEKGFSPSHAYSDSPGGGYANNRQSPLIQNNSTSVGSFDSCVLNFKANLDLEQYRDYFNIYGSGDDGTNWEFLGSLTGTTGSWVNYFYPLTAYSRAKVGFLLLTNEAVSRDGVYLDDIQLLGDPLVSITPEVPGKATLISPSGTVSIPTPTYTWNPVTNATWYQLWVNDSGTNSKIQAWYTAAQAGCASGMGTCSVTPTTPLVTGAAQWWIQTWNDAGYGPWSDATGFTIAMSSAAIQMREETPSISRR
jgi:hypothetical protein